VKIFKGGFVLLLMLACFVAVAKAQTSSNEAMPFPTAKTPAAVDRGMLSAESGASAISVTVVLRLPGATAAENLLETINTPGNGQYHKFLTGDQFTARFGPKDSDVAAAIAGLAKYGLSAVRTSATTLRVTGMPAAMERAFGVTLHSYEVDAQEGAPGYRYHAPLGQVKVPTELQGVVSGVVGLDSRPAFRPHFRKVNANLTKVKVQAEAAASSGSSGNVPGEWTVEDFANYYDLNPLYKRGLTGKGSTLAIVTLASFTPSDAFAYWSALGLKVNPKRVHIINVDGGPGAPSDASGSFETTIDVQQSGGIAPQAKVLVYQAPNEGQTFLDAFAKAIEDNTADSISTSWGGWEWFYNLENNPVTDPKNGKTVSFAQALHELLLRAAIQGQSVFAASGDGGAYQVNDQLGCVPSSDPACSITLSVELPSSDPFITSAGGTTVPVEIEFCLNAACTPPYYDVNIKKERVWGWDYQIGLCKALGYDPVSCGIFPVGSNGGVSFTYPAPSYQAYLPGVQKTQPKQAFVYDGEFYFVQPPYFPGRNTPDISANADPYTGYVAYYSSSAQGFGLYDGNGGTSFVAPQLNGVMALINQECEGRQGLVNYALYRAARNGHGYSGSNAPLNYIVQGDNWFYTGNRGYSPAAGLGTLDIANFAAYLQNQK
jgi:kumamolisin